MPAPTAPPSGPSLPAGYTIDPVPHLGFARMVARVVRALPYFGFPPGSAEEEELEEVARVELCRLARRFDPSRVRPDSAPGALFQGAFKRSIMTACLRAAWKLKRNGLCELPKKAAPRCATCSETLAATSADRRLDDWREECFGDEAEDGDESGPMAPAGMCGATLELVHADGSRTIYRPDGSVERIEVRRVGG